MIIRHLPYLAVVMGIRGFFYLSLYFTLLFPFFSLLFIGLGRRRRQSAQDRTIGWIVTILSVVVAYWLAGHMVDDVFSVAGRLFLGYFVTLGWVGSRVSGFGWRFMTFVTLVSLVISVLLLGADNVCNANRFYFPWNRLGC